MTKTLVAIFGSLTLALVLYLIPILLICSFVFEWHTVARFFLIWINVMEFICLTFSIVLKVEVEHDE